MKAFILFFLCSTAYAQSMVDEVLLGMNSFMPQQVIDGYTDSPEESSLTPQAEEDKNWLLQKSLLRKEQDKTALFVFETQRPNISVNFKEDALAYAEKLLDHHDDERLCHYEPVPCETKQVEKNCEDRAIYMPYVCENTLQVKVHRIDHTEVKRTLVKNLNTIDLTSCGSYSGGFCRDNAVFKLNDQCAHLDVHLTALGKELEIVKSPTCAQPTLTFSYNGNAQLLVTTIHLTEYWSEDTWVKSECLTQDAGFCVAGGQYQCLYEHQTRSIEGVPITRACWGQKYQFQCSHDTISSCKPLIDAGCANVNVSCTKETNGHCDVYEKRFLCPDKTCFPDQWVCPETLPCVNGSCDNTKDEEASSNDMSTGISQLGVLAGVADKVAQDQVQSDEPRLFKGEVVTCNSYVWGARDCCFDKGFLDDLIHCPEKMQVLQRAKVEGRAVFVGEYKDDFFKTKHAYCVFPTRLAAIIQMDGRGTQLGISFGEPRAPDCRGISPNELANIRFDDLDLSGVIDELKARSTLPERDVIEAKSLEQALGLYDKGQIHD